MKFCILSFDQQVEHGAQSTEIPPPKKKKLKKRLVFSQDAVGAQSSLASHELERMREDRRQLLAELQEERQQLEEARKDRKSLEEDVFKLKMEREQHTRRLK